MLMQLLTRWVWRIHRLYINPEIDHTSVFSLSYLQNPWLNLMLWVRIPLRWGVLDTTLCDKVGQQLAAVWWFSLCTPVSSTNKTDRHDIAEILSKVVLNTITLTHCSIKASVHSNYQVDAWIQTVTPSQGF
jgi:hypothetical protein